MKPTLYTNTQPAVFLERLNRFIARVEVSGHTETVHVKNTGRCRELLIPGCNVILQKANPTSSRKTPYDLISVKKAGLGWVNIDSQVCNTVMYEWLQKQDYTSVRSEYSYGASRIDFLAETPNDKWLIEVKGCTLEIDGTGYFPDAPSARAVKHLQQLTSAIDGGYRCAIAFVIAMNGIHCVQPNRITDPAFAAALAQARCKGVEIWFMCCEVTESTLKIIERIKA